MAISFFPLSRLWIFEEKSDSNLSRHLAHSNSALVDTDPWKISSSPVFDADRSEELVGGDFNGMLVFDALPLSPYIDYSYIVSKNTVQTVTVNDFTDFSIFKFLVNL